MYLDLSELTTYERDFVRLVFDKVGKIDIDYLRNLINGDS